jgi:hypothetical protein
VCKKWLLAKQSEALLNFYEAIDAKKYGVKLSVKNEKNF